MTNEGTPSGVGTMLLRGVGWGLQYVANEAVTLAARGVYEISPLFFVPESLNKMSGRYLADRYMNIATKDKLVCVDMKTDLDTRIKNIQEAETLKVESLKTMFNDKYGKIENFEARKRAVLADRQIKNIISDIISLETQEDSLNSQLDTVEDMIALKDESIANMLEMKGEFMSTGSVANYDFFYRVQNRMDSSKSSAAADSEEGFERKEFKNRASSKVRKHARDKSSEDRMTQILSSLISGKGFEKAQDIVETDVEVEDSKQRDREIINQLYITHDNKRKQADTA